MIQCLTGPRKTVNTNCIGYNIAYSLSNNTQRSNAAQQFSRECWKLMKEGKLEANKTEIIKFWDKLCN